MKMLVTLLPLAALVSGMANAQDLEPRLRCDGEGNWGIWRGWRRNEHFCEIRETTVAPTGSLTVDAGPNGHVTVRGWNRDEVLVRAMVQAWARDVEDAEETASAVEVSTDGTIEADGPRSDPWSVSYEIFAPVQTDLDLEAFNGGIAIEDIHGTLDFEAHNGGLALNRLAGDVRGETVNGGISVTLTGDTWDGDGLDVRTTNGGIVMRVPEGYSAQLETSTVNGGLVVEFPVTVRGRIGRELSTTLGDGGPLVRAATVNGGVVLSDRMERRGFR